MLFFFFSSRRRHTRFKCDWSSDVCSSDLRRTERESAESRKDTGGASVLFRAARAGACRDRGQWAVAVVRAAAGGVGAWVVDRGRGEAPRHVRAKDEDHPAGCAPVVSVAYV